MTTGTALAAAVALGIGAMLIGGFSFGGEHGVGMLDDIGFCTVETSPLLLVVRVADSGAADTGTTGSEVTGAEVVGTIAVAVATGMGWPVLIGIDDPL